MRVLLDECIPRNPKNSLLGHECRTVSDEGWAGKKNGDLLALADKSGFDVFLTLDRGIEYQQNLRPRNITIVLIRTKPNRLADVVLHVPAILKTLESVKPGQCVTVG